MSSHEASPVSLGIEVLHGSHINGRTMKIICIRKNIFVPMGKRIYCSCHPTWLPCKTSIGYGMLCLSTFLLSLLLSWTWLRGICFRALPFTEDDLSSLLSNFNIATSFPNSSAFLAVEFLALDLSCWSTFCVLQIEIESRSRCLKMLILLQSDLFHHLFLGCKAFPFPF